MRSALFTCCVDKFREESPFRQYPGITVSLPVRVAGTRFLPAAFSGEWRTMQCWRGFQPGWCVGKRGLPQPPALWECTVFPIENRFFPRGNTRCITLKQVQKIFLFSFGKMAFPPWKAWPVSPGMASVREGFPLVTGVMEPGFYTLEKQVFVIRMNICVI